MDEITDLKEQFRILELPQKLNFIDALTHLFEQKEIELGHSYDNAAVEEKLKLLNRTMGLRQLIYSLKDQSRTTRKNPYDEANVVWNALSQYFDVAA
ncbi:hypothetical protein [Shewanella frigidimarina]|uniref:hypothetical protein n=1 Tax=Shewanella frigidimarina TaxID=56812 RepID=UPI003D79BD1E